MDNPLSSILLSSALTLLSPIAFADNGEQNHLQLTPSVCIIDATTSHCRIRVQFHWQTDAKKTICIESREGSFEPWCNQDPSIRSHTIEIHAHTDMHFLLVDKLTQHRLADATFTVTHPNQTSERRRYRNPWSLF
ncbi:DUF3019 domain-containing protein [Shewanella sp. NIFS-20-20]|uniref:DUF3019 domain-containing protein n=1 Tax=Shewanella sp. NIFS-20-20 TaxID=2853806 RepID=UPI001C452E1D|nr:DUF3019 domain-containing protein [Shewanella sp. NIFS-20-20]MBV7314450.1 DUF3019 domain-containing protein [Shewanella sp. NIFS-20-20]